MKAFLLALCLSPALAQDTGVARKVELAPGVTMEFVYIPPGSYQRGSAETEAGRDPDEGPRHRVTISRGFYLGRTEVTQQQWAALMGDQPATFRQPNGEAISQRPVETVSWTRAQDFLSRLNALAQGRFRLPTEAEWEYAARAGTETAFPWGDATQPFTAYPHAWANSRSFGTTHAVATKPPNAWGLYDMHGNVWEWCADWYGPYEAEPQTDPAGPPRGTEKVFRGGSWFDFPVSLRSANRHRHGTDKGYAAIGFRVLLEASVLEERSVVLPGGVAMRFAKIPPGEFMMGSPESEAGRQKDESPQHRVRVERAFWLGVYEVTQAQWRAVMGSDPSAFRETAAGGALPVEMISWNDAQAYLQKLNALGQGSFRLPAEAEWEYAARAGSAARYPHGDDPGYRELRRYAWFNPESEGRSHPVGRKRPNPWGLYDMLGGVWEWVEDALGAYPQGPRDQSKRVIRGGSWFNEAEALRSANRNAHEPDSRQTNLGLRLVWEPR